MRIAIDFTGCVGGGAITYLKNFPKALVAIDNINEYFFIAEHKWEYELGGISSNSHFIGMPCESKDTLKRLLWQQLMMPRLLKRIKTDMIYSTTNIAPLVSSCPIVLAFRIPPKVLTGFRSKLRHVMMKASLNKATSVITVSGFAKNEIVKSFNIPRRKIHVVYHGISSKFRKKEETLSYKTSYSLQHPFILSISVLYPHKNHISLIKAFEIIKRKHKCKHKLVIIGDCPDKSYFNKLVDMIRRYNLEEEIFLIPGVSHDEIVDWYRSADIYVLPSFHETFGLTLIEAMACGIPVITSNISAMPEIGGEAALYFNPNDPEDMAEIIWNVLSDSKLREKMISLGKRCAQNFSWEHTAKKTLEIIEEIWGQIRNKH